MQRFDFNLDYLFEFRRRHEDRMHEVEALAPCMSIETHLK
ncbi:Uncharacterized protein ChrSV_1671 [Chromobacterium vaccinii]|nr:Uncharacterized protein ChrSW_1671 [Chromobacterium vaccinii]QND89129.1 Uncharacterized protein ChrSV_1671 [Chromobacterium vaccinii]